MLWRTWTTPRIRMTPKRWVILTLLVLVALAMTIALRAVMGPALSGLPPTPTLFDNFVVPDLGAFKPHLPNWSYSSWALFISIICLVGTAITGFIIYAQREQIEKLEVENIWLHAELTNLRNGVP